MFTRGDTVKSDLYPGIALWIVESNEDEHGNVIVRMIGDDRDFEASPETLHVVEEDEFCSGCGQIGCHAYG